jgi:integrase
VRYYDMKGVRRRKTFQTRKEADLFASSTTIDLDKGVHIPDRDSVTVAEAGKLWVADCEARGLDHFSVKRNRQHVEGHIAPRIGSTRLNAITVPAVNAFKARLLSEGVSQSLAKMVLVSLGSLIAYAQGEGLASTNAVRDVARTKKAQADKRIEERHEEPVKKGKDFPLPTELREILAKATGRTHAIVAVLAFTGLRSSELRALRWVDTDLDEHMLTVSQRADQRGEIGSPKSKTSRRTVPLLPLVVRALETWREQCPLTRTGEKGADGKPIKKLELVFPNSEGGVEDHHNLERRTCQRAQFAAGITARAVHKRTGKPVLGKHGETKGKQLTGARYQGLHSLRHAFASWSLERREKGGAGVDMKTLQVRMGHSSYKVTADLYTHLLPQAGVKKEMADIEAAFLAA